MVEHYIGLIDAGRLDDARRLWADPAAAETGNLAQARVGMPGSPEGAAGSIYVDIPLTAPGQRDRIVTLRRANDVPGATARQLGWRIYSIR